MAGASGAGTTRVDAVAGRIPVDQKGEWEPMSGRKAFFTVLITLLVIAILVAAGVMLYRMGVARGLAMAEALPFAGGFMHPYGYGMPGFDGACPRAWRHPGGMPFGGGHMPFSPFGFGGWLVGLLVLAGFIALVVAGINALTRKPQAEVQVVAAPPAPVAPAPEPTPIKPARGAGRSRTTKR